MDSLGCRQVKGVYTLLFRITKDFSRTVGSLGRVHFENGNYAYVGSAQSSLFSRLERHYAKKKRVHWHIDYLTTSKNTRIKGAVYSAGAKKMECKLSATLSSFPYVASFRSTDCRCRSRLFF